MYVGNDFPDMSPTDLRRLTLDFVNDLDPVVPETIVSAIWSCEVPPELNPALTDGASQSHVIGNETIYGTQIIQQIGGLVAGVIYRMRCVATTSAGAQPELYTHVRCVAPV